METAIYCRVSTDEQMREGFSIRAQEQKLKEFTNVKDWSIYNIYIDEGISGKNITERPAINRMITDIRAGHVKNVLVFKLDRLTRSVADLVSLIDIFKQHDCAFNSLMESLDTSTASGRMFIKIIGIFAEFERENIAERVRIGCERKAREGYTTAKQWVSYGYDRDKGQNIQTVNEAEAVIVREVFDMFVNQGLSFSGIAKRLNLRKVPSKSKSVWNAAKIKAILTNCNYVGRVRYCFNEPIRSFEADGLHKAIIADELYNEAQNIISKIPKTTKTKRPLERNYYAGLLTCAKCGTKITPHYSYRMYKGKKHETYSYTCGHRTMKACDAPNMTHKNVEAAFRDFMFSEYNDFTVGDTIELEKRENIKRETEAQIKAYRDKLRHIDGKEKEVMSFYLDGNIDFDNYRKMKTQLDADREIIQSELSKIDTAADEGAVTVTHDQIITSFRENWDLLNDVEKRQFLIKFVKRIVIFNERTEGVYRGKIKIEAVDFNCM